MSKFYFFPTDRLQADTSYCYELQNITNTPSDEKPFSVSGPTQAFSRAGLSIILFISILMAGYSSYGQNFTWVGRSDASSNEQAMGVCTDLFGNTYTVGRYTGTATFGGTTLTSNGITDIFVTKQDAEGKFIWAKSAGGASYEDGYGIATDATGNVFITGDFAGTVSFGSTSLTSGGTGSLDVLVLKYDSAGTILWAVNGGTSSNDVGRSISTDAAGNCYVTGNYVGTASFDGKTLSSSGNNDIFIAKFDGATGKTIWAAKGGGGNSDIGYGIKASTLNSVFVTGQFGATAKFGTASITSSGLNDIFIAKYDTAGTLSWVKHAGSKMDDIGYSITADDSDNCFLTGYFNDTAYFDTDTLITKGGQDVYIAKYDAAGKLSWLNQAGGSSFENGRGIDVDGAGNCYVMGQYYTQTLYFGSDSLTNRGDWDIFVAKYTAGGHFAWAARAASTMQDYAQGICAEKNGNIRITGYYNGTTAFGTITYSNKGEDAYIGKIGSFPNIYSFSPGSGKAGTSLIISGSDFTGTTAVNFGSISVSSYTINSNHTITLTVPAGFTKEKITITTANGSYTSMQSFTLIPPLTANAGSDTSICAGDSVTLGTTNIFGHTYSWTSKPAGFTSTDANPVVRPTLNTMYYLTEADTSGISKDSLTIKVNALPNSGMYISSYFGFSVSFMAKDTALLAYLWDFGDGNTGSGFAPTHKYSKTGIFPVSLTVTNKAGCTSTSYDTVKLILTGLTNSSTVKTNLSISPNPFSDNTLINYSLAHIAEVQMSLYNIQGKLITILQRGQQQVGNYQFLLNPTEINLHPGAYILRLNINGEVNYKQIIFK